MLLVVLLLYARFQHELDETFAVGTSIPGVELFQIVQTTPASLRVRLRPASSAGADPERVWRAVRAEITRLLTGHGLGHVTVERAGEPPEQSPGGKYRTIIPLSQGPES